jgi:hypothetical protein
MNGWKKLEHNLKQMAGKKWTGLELWTPSARKNDERPFARFKLKEGKVVFDASLMTEKEAKFYLKRVKSKPDDGEEFLRKLAALYSESIGTLVVPLF